MKAGIGGIMPVFYCRTGSVPVRAGIADGDNLAKKTCRLDI